jgi:hypothetical protein
MTLQWRAPGGALRTFEAIARVDEALQLPENRNKSNRALAAELGVDEKMVRKGRTAEQSAVEPRIGLDGKTRRMPKRKTVS